MRRWARGFDVLSGDAGTGGAPTVFDDFGPTPAQLAEVAKGRAQREAAAASSKQAQFDAALTAGKAPGAAWYMRERAGLPVFGWIAIGLSTLMVGAGVYEGLRKD